MTKKKRRTAPGLVADRSCKYRAHHTKGLLQSHLEERCDKLDLAWDGHGSARQGAQCICGTVDGHPEESDRVTVVQSRLC